MKNLSLMIAICSIGLLCASLPSHAQTPANKAPQGEIINLRAGDYLSSRFAQKNHDWKKAHSYIAPLIHEAHIDYDIIQRAMILSMGAGETSEAIRIAYKIKGLFPDHPNTIADIFIISDTFKSGDAKKARAIFNTVPQDGTINYIGPLMKGWLDAANGVVNIDNLKQNTMQLYHGILISDFMGDHKDIEALISKALNVEDINPSELERIADLYGHVGLKDKAIGIYKQVQKYYPENKKIDNKISDLKQGLNEPLFKKLGSAREGLARAYYDISTVLHKENNDESALVFANLALHLDPNLIQSKLLLADMAAQNKQHKEAISYYSSVPKKHKDYIKAQHAISDIYKETRQFKKSLKLLNSLLKDSSDDIDTYIKIGHLHRSQGHFDLALKAYDIADKKLNDGLSNNYWHLYYARGITYEKADKWANAEKDLKHALTLQPEHPYILNYLAYAWADQGVHLEQSLEMLQRAVNLRPSDGYITDSLGWVLYRTGDYNSAVTVLERAVELRPHDPTINDHLGDAYWKIGRKLEARFQWNRAKSQSDDKDFQKEIDEKLLIGLSDA